MQIISSLLLLTTAFTAVVMAGGGAKPAASTSSAAAPAEAPAAVAASTTAIASGVSNLNATLSAINATINGTTTLNTTQIPIGSNCTVGNGICSAGLVCDTSRSTPRCINIVPLDGTCDDLNVCLTGGDDASLICLLGKCQLRPNKLILQEIHLDCILSLKHRKVVNKIRFFID